jgi:anti-sigma regulatory factor (Ser/Thr protein kinase)
MVASSFSLLHADLPVCIGYQAAGRRVETRHCLLPARADSVSAARRFVRDVSEDWSPRPRRLEMLLENLGIVVSELVTNALVHAYAAVGAPVAPADPFAGDPGPLSLCLIREPCDTGVERVVFAVADPSSDAPVAASAQQAAGGLWGLCESGRGMTLVEALADDWGWRRVRGPGGSESAGKVVWALFELAC